MNIRDILRQAGYDVLMADGTFFDGIEYEDGKVSQP